MPTLLMRLAGPMQSWGTRSRFDERDSEKEPSKSGVIGLLCAALGVDRHDEAPVLKLAAMPMGVRIDREGVLQRDYHTAQKVIRADGKGVQNTAVSHRFFLADAVFLVGLESSDSSYLEHIQQAIKNPYWPLFLGRKSFVPSRPIWLEGGLKAQGLRESLVHYPWLTDHAPSRLLLEGTRGSLRTDQPLSNFSERRFGTRFVESSPWEQP